MMRHRRQGIGNWEFGIRSQRRYSAFRIPHCALRPCDLALAVVLCLGGGVSLFAETANRIVAIVNDEVITESDVTSRLNALLEDRESPPSNEAHDVEMQHVILRRLIEQQLMLQEARKAGIASESDEVSKRFEQLRSQVGSEQEFRESLAKSHLSESQLKEKIREQLLVQRLIDTKVRAQIVGSPRMWPKPCRRTRSLPRRVIVYASPISLCA